MEGGVEAGPPGAARECLHGARLAVLAVQQSARTAELAGLHHLHTIGSVHGDQGAGQHVEAGLDHALVAEADAHARLGALPFPLLVQGAEPRATLIDRFRATPGAVLLGTGSFWEGVDVPGDALSLVVIDKLPFAPHTDPLVAARMRRIEERGGDPFDEIQVPAAAIALKQGFGRLIRRRDDRGIVAVLDPRIVTRNYGRAFLTSLPAGLPRTSVLEQVRRWWTAGPGPG